MAFLADISKFNKNKLQQSETIVTTSTGQRHVERLTDDGFEKKETHVASTGFIVSNEARESDPVCMFILSAAYF